MASSDPSEVAQARAAVWVGVAIFLSGPAVVVYQAFHWLKYAVWEPITVQSVTGWRWHWADTGWVGLNVIVDWLVNFVIDLPVSVVLLIVGGLTWLGAAEGLREAEQRARWAQAALRKTVDDPDP